MNTHSIAVIGATGNVGRKVVELLINKNLVSAKRLKLLASGKSAGKSISIANSDFIIEKAEPQAFEGCQICIFNTESDVSEQLVPLALAAGAYVIDSSSHYRLDPAVPLIIPPVNQHLITKEKRLYSHANCLASPISVVIAPLHQKFGIKRVNAVTYQSTSGAGKNAMDACWAETKSVISNTTFTHTHFPRQIAFNVIPQVGSFREDGFTSEEFKIIHEIRKVVDQELLVTSTAVRVPVMVGHSIALTLEFKQPFEVKQLLQTLEKSPGVTLSQQQYTTPIEVEGSDEVFVGRVRIDPSVPNGLHLWLCADNLRRGAALDAVEMVAKLLHCL